VLAERLVVKGSGNFRVGLGEGQRHAIGHIRILEQFLILRNRFPPDRAVSLS